MNTLVLTVLVAVLPLAALPARENAEKSPAEQIADLTGFERSGFEAARAAFKPVIDQFRAEGYDAEVIRKIEAAADAFFHKVMSDPALKTEIATLYRDNFSADELEELLAFYQTPLGRKTLAQLPRIMEKSIVLGQQVAEKHSPAFQDQLTDILAEAHAEPPRDQPGKEPTPPEADPQPK